MSCETAVGLEGNADFLCKALKVSIMYECMNRLRRLCMDV